MMFRAIFAFIAGLVMAITSMCLGGTLRHAGRLALLAQLKEKT